MSKQGLYNAHPKQYQLGSSKCVAHNTNHSEMFGVVFTTEKDRVVKSTKSDIWNFCKEEWILPLHFY